MNATRQADRIVADRLRLAADRERLPAPEPGATAAQAAATVSAGSAHAGRFTREITAAVAGTALALEAARPHPDDLWAAAAAAHPDPIVWFEQAVTLGHPTHPLARSRGDLTADQIRAFAPEHRPRIDLPAYDLAPTRTRGRRPSGARLPVHPWQAERHGLTGPAHLHRDAAPLMSLRTVSTGPDHIKCAVDLQLTSAVRHVSDAAAANGPILARHLRRPAAACGITVLPEAATQALDPAGEPIPALSAIIRPAPHSLGLDRTIPLAALAEPCPATGRPLAAALAGDDLEPWWAALAHTLTGVLRLFETTGVALEAHGQNLLVAFDGDRPTGLVYRDFGGVRLPPDFAPGLTGDPPCPDADERARKLLAALFPTTLAALVDALAAWTGTDPGRWWKTLANAIADTGQIGRTALEQPWPIKATTAMRLADRPTDDIWTRIDNPLADT
ncbi:IucA/IucC family protein [Glycomyces salinus]|uniref:IucA/IucC family protein n=1 Tax=Glycomyces salinus TaxID=980294 RepID=UPI0018EAE2D7|nr:IucA/IucC family protein [Glycomyces salinus]